MRFDSATGQLAVTALVIAAALAFSTMLDGWHWGLLFPAIAIAAVSGVNWRRARKDT